MPSPLSWPATDVDDHGPAWLEALQRWLASDGLPELPPEHAALATWPFGVHLDLRALTPDVPDAWATVFLSQHATASLATWVTWTTRGGDQGHAFAPPGVAWATAPILLALMRRLTGDAIELRYALAGQVPLLPRGTWVHPDGWWDEWKSRRTDVHEDAPTQGRVYRERLYPMVLQALARATEGRALAGVVDVCGGDGELAALLPGAVTLIERNRVACDQARARPGLTVVEGDAADAASWAGVSADVVLMVGAIQGNVMPPAAAARVVGHAVAALRPGGLLIVAGWSPCLLDSDGFRAAGLEVYTACPPTDEDPNPRQLYLLRRP